MIQSFSDRDTEKLFYADLFMKGRHPGNFGKNSRRDSDGGAEVTVDEPESAPDAIFPDSSTQRCRLAPYFQGGGLRHGPGRYPLRAPASAEATQTPRTVSSSAVDRC